MSVASERGITMQSQLQSATADANPKLPVLDKPRHIKYWLRNLKTLLPHHYTGNESNRMYLAFFTLNALDLLSAYESHTSESERAEHISWIYRCQHPHGGFRMWPGTDFGSRANAENARWDPANIPATYFALATLLVLRDDFKRVRRSECLNWLLHMQRPDGSFGETIIDDNINGGKDPRFGYCAMGIRYILRGGSQEGPIAINGHEIKDVDLDAFVESIRESESYDGGIADEPYHEPHAGYTYCALAALDFARRLGVPNGARDRAAKIAFDPSRTLEWLVQQQTDWIDPDSAYPEEEAGVDPWQMPSESMPHVDPSEPLHQPVSLTTMNPPFIEVAPSASEIIAGFAGRPNKVADTCYAWWVCGALALWSFGRLDGDRLRASSASTPASPSLPIFDSSALRRYLLDTTGTQHPILGGFGKFPGDPPDLYHSYLGLAVLGLMTQDGDDGLGVKQVDGGMCISVAARERVATLWQ